MEPVDAMKEANLVIGRKGKYKNLSGDEAQRILKETDDHIFQREVDDLSPDDFASGGRIGYAAGKIVKGGKWVIKNLERALKELAEGTYQKGLGPMEKEAFKWEIKGLIGRIRMGEPIPEDMIKTMRQDPRFKDIVKTRSTDPDLYEMEDVILNYGKKGDVVDEQVEILEKFTPTGKGHASGGRVPLMYGGDPGFAV